MSQLPLKRVGLFVIALLALVIVPTAASAQDDLFSRPSDEKEPATAGIDADGTTVTATEQGDPSSPAANNQKDNKESNARIEKQSDGWYTVTDDASAVEVRLPSKPKYKDFSWSPLKGRPALTNHIYTSLTDDKQISVDYSWYDMHEAPASSRALKNALDGAVKGSVVNVLGQLTKMENVKSGKVNGREFEFTFTLNLPKGKSAAMQGQSQVFIKGKRRYQMNVISYAGKQDAALATKLFDSLLIKDD